MGRPKFANVSGLFLFSGKMQGKPQRLGLCFPGAPPPRSSCEGRKNTKKNEVLLSEPEARNSKKQGKGKGFSVI